jgi:hypothetical protein
MPAQPHDEALSLPPLSADDQHLVDAYVQVGRVVDQLPYSTDFEGLVKRVGSQFTLEVKYRIYQRLLALRKRGRLPRLVRGAGAY